jgi:hypothetical protein
MYLEHWSLGVLDDASSYYNDRSSTQNVSKGMSSPSTSEPGVFHLRGAGWLRFMTAKWEIVGYGFLKSAGTTVLVTMAQKTTLTPQSLSIYAKEKTGLSDEEVKGIIEILKTLGNVLLNQELGKLQMLPMGK